MYDICELYNGWYHDVQLTKFEKMLSKLVKHDSKSWTWLMQFKNYNNVMGEH